MFADFEKQNVKVIGVSMDSLESHKQFADNHDLPFPLLADTDGALAAKFGVDTSGGFAERVTFLIDEQGKVAKVYPDVTPTSHAGEVLADCGS